MRIFPPNLSSHPCLPNTHLHEDCALTGSLILVSLVQGLFLNLLPVSFQFAVRSFGLQEGDTETAETPLTCTLLITEGTLRKRSSPMPPGAEKERVAEMGP